MDEQLKRRLMGAAIVVALVVIFVPMLFEDKSAGPAGGEAGIPALPEAIEEKPMELPKSAADVAPTEKSEAGRPASSSGYRIVPLDDPPPKPAKAETPVPAPQATASGAEGATAPVEEEFAGEPEQAPAAKPEPKPETAGRPSTAKEAAGQAPPAKKPKRLPDPAQNKAAPKTSARATPREPNEMPPAIGEVPDYSTVRPESKAPPPPARAIEPPARKLENARPATARPPTPKPDSSGTKSAASKPLPPEAAYKPSAESVTGKPQDTKRAPEAAVPSSWVVQAGSFAAEANARSLAERLRKQNLPANVYVSQAESGPIYRVTVGPELNRARAEQIQKQIENAVGIKGIVLPQR